MPFTASLLPVHLSASSHAIASHNSIAPSSVVVLAVTLAGERVLGGEVDDEGTDAETESWQGRAVPCSCGEWSLVSPRLSVVVILSAIVSGTLRQIGSQMKEA